MVEIWLVSLDFEGQILMSKREGRSDARCRSGSCDGPLIPLLGKPPPVAYVPVDRCGKACVVAATSVRRTSISTAFFDGFAFLQVLHQSDVRRQKITGATQTERRM